MSKIAGLRTAHELLHISRNNTARHRLFGWPLHPDDEPTEVRLIYYSLLLVEIEDHIQSLEGIAAMCSHALAGTVPIDHYLAPETFDPWAAIELYLSDEFMVPVGTLSPALLAWLEARPRKDRDTTVKLQQILNHRPWVEGDDGRLRPPTDEEHQRAPETDMLHSMEQTFFALTYAADLAEVATLVETRGDLGRIATLVA